MSMAPVIAIDGPTASGKGNDRSGGGGAHWIRAAWTAVALYRVVPRWLALRPRGSTTGDALRLAQVGARSAQSVVRARGASSSTVRTVTEAIRAEEVGAGRPRTCRLTRPVRDELVAAAALVPCAGPGPGGRRPRHGATVVVFPTRGLKVFLTASVEVRAAARRLKQLMEKVDFLLSLADLFAGPVRGRDERDRQRARWLRSKAADDAYELDASSLTVDEVVGQVLDWYRTVSQLQ